MTNTVIWSECYQGSSAAYHMIGSKEFFNNVEEKELQLDIDLKFDGSYNTKTNWDYNP